MERPPLRQKFKQNLAKLLQLNTRTQAMKEIQTLIVQHKTTTNLRIWLSVLSESRNKHTESEVQVLGFIVQQYGKGLLDPLDKLPSLEKTVWRVTELVMRCFTDQLQNVALACQRVWLELYHTTLDGETTELKKKLLYSNLEAIITGGGGKIAQMTAQLVLDGLLEAALAKEDHEFFKQLAKRSLILFLKTTIPHPATLTSLQTIISFFNINNLIPLLEQIFHKLKQYVTTAQPNSTGYKIKGEVCNCFAIIGEQIDRNGVSICEKVLKLVGEMATDKVWAVQAPGRRALGIWKSNKSKWDEEFEAKKSKIESIDADKVPVERPTNYESEQWNLKNMPLNESEYPKTYQQNWASQRQQPSPKKPETYQEGWNRSSQQIVQNPYQQQYLHKNTGMGGGNNVQSVQNYYERQRSQDTHTRKMEELKKSIYKPKNQDIEFEETVVWEESKGKKSSPARMDNIKETGSSREEQNDPEFLDRWEQILTYSQKGKYEQAIRELLDLDDDLYFLRYFLKYSPEILESLTRSTSKKVLKKMLEIKKTNFMEQMLFKMVAESAKAGIGQMLTNSQNLQIAHNLENARKASSLKQVSERLIQMYEKSIE